MTYVRWPPTAYGISGSRQMRVCYNLLAKQNQTLAEDEEKYGWRERQWTLLCKQAFDFYAGIAQPDRVPLL